MTTEITQIRTPAEKALISLYTSEKDRLPGSEAVKALRSANFAEFERSGLPHRRIESWHYTDLRSQLREAAPLFAEGSSEFEDSRRHVQPKIPEGYALVLLDGIFVPELSQLDELPDSVNVRSLGDVLAQGDANLVERLAPKGLGTGDPALSLNAALMQGGVVVDVAPSIELAKPLIVLSVMSAGAVHAAYHRSLVRVGAGAKLTLFEIVDAVEIGSNQQNGVLVLEMGDGAEVEHLTRISRQGADAIIIRSVLATLGANCRYDGFALIADGGVVRRQIFLRFDGEHSTAGIRGLSLLSGKRHADTTLVVDHAVPHCTSREYFKHIIADEATGVYQGKVIVRPHAQKTDGAMKSRALLLSDSAAMFNKPELEIFADDVVCGHGATVAQLDEDQLFYLRSRGLPRAEAEQLLLEAFANEAVEHVQNEGARERLMGYVSDWLAARK
ncbi:MAG: Fe-S cluster assembly protein SufD [Methylobacteriaceae bacterium]|jgi:Fe-S cluster assembly protein SufD|nr:Fe-S cluster assembly protein SufD [Methylobacteriaceae bacterium]